MHAPRTPQPRRALLLTVQRRGLTSLRPRRPTTLATAPRRRGTLVEAFGRVPRQRVRRRDLRDAPPRALIPRRLWVARSPMPPRRRWQRRRPRPRAVLATAPRRRGTLGDALAEAPRPRVRRRDLCGGSKCAPSPLVGCGWPRARSLGAGDGNGDVPGGARLSARRRDDGGRTGRRRGGGCNATSTPRGPFAARPSPSRGESSIWSLRLSFRPPRLHADGRLPRWHCPRGLHGEGGR